MMNIMLILKIRMKILFFFNINLMEEVNYEKNYIIFINCRNSWLFLS